jgi:D-alanyl-D-alanine carboxypeptidase
LPDATFAPNINVVDAEIVRADDLDEPEASANPGAPETSGAPVAPAAPEALAAPDDTYQNDSFFTVPMHDSDIYRGNLLLINRDHTYDISEDLDIIPAADAKTPSYRVADGDVTISASITSPLNDMMDAFFDETGISIVTIASGFRDYEKQQEILDTYTRRFGRNEALKWASPPGTSEHHSGLAVDFGVLNRGTVRTFTGTGDYSWFAENSYKYGFILRFTDKNTDITGVYVEPWHFRYVGNPHAYFMFQNDWCFEEYVELLMQHTFDDPYMALYDGILY